jgi:hypothetical protein
MMPKVIYTVNPVCSAPPAAMSSRERDMSADRHKERNWAVPSNFFTSSDREESEWQRPVRNHLLPSERGLSAAQVFCRIKRDFAENMSAREYSL